LSPGWGSNSEKESRKERDYGDDNDDFDKSDAALSHLFEAPQDAPCAAGTSGRKKCSARSKLTQATTALQHNRCANSFMNAFAIAAL